MADSLHLSTSKTLTEDQAAANPFGQFRLWFEEALRADLPQPEAMTLATSTRDGRPSARMVLLKQVDERGFVFHTNYRSRKGWEIEENPWAAAILFWAELRRQIRIEGQVEKLSAAESDAYFSSRDAGSRLAAWASPQSRVIDDRASLERRMGELTMQYRGRDVPRPDYWGGYRLRPVSIEFWQGRPDRLHDRLRYRRDADGGWVIERLAP